MTSTEVILTEDQWKLAKRMRHEGYGWNKIGKALGISGNTVHRKFEPRFDEHRRATDRAYRESHKKNLRVGHRVCHGRDGFHVPHDILAERDRRMNVELTLSQYYFGDPPPGRSALDKKQRTFNV